MSGGMQVTMSGMRMHVANPWWVARCACVHSLWQFWQTPVAQA